MRPGSDIRVCRKPADYNALRLRALLEDSFGRSLRDDYPLDKLATAYIEADYRGAALLEAHPMGRYLTKFAVGTEARGIGLANELWDALIEQEPVLFWRARKDNPIRAWYDQLADGLHRSDEWIVYWRGVDDAQISEVISFCTNKPSDFAERDRDGTA